MKLGLVQGKLFCSVIDPKLRGAKLYVVQPLDENLKPMGSKIIAADGVGTQEGQIVFWVSAREASLCIVGKEIPADAGIVGIVDGVGG